MDIWMFFGKNKLQPDQEDMESEISSPPTPEEEQDPH